MMRARIAGTKAWCARQGCTGPFLGRVPERHDGGDRILALRGQRWRWDPGVEPPRYRRGRHSDPTSAIATRPGATDLGLARDVVVIRSESGTWWTTVSLPVVVECPACSGVQEIA